MADITITTTESKDIIVQPFVQQSAVNVSGTPFAPLRFPILKIIDRNLYIVCDKGFLQNSDMPFFARYVRSKDRISNGNGHSIMVRRHTGWIRPRDPASQTTPKSLHVPMSMVLSAEKSDEQHDYWILSVNDSTDIANALSAIEDKSLELKSNGSPARQLRLIGKKLGVCIERNGVMLTDYLHFRVVMHVRSSGNTFHLSRWL